jgi:hypothetical protein
MAVREFDGVDDRIALGSLEEPLVNGAYSIIALVKPSGTLPGGKAYVALRSGSSMVASLGDGGAGKIADYTDAAGQDAVAGLTVGAWQIIAVTKPAGTSTVRFHRKQLGSGSWTHANGGTLPDVPGTVDNLVLGGMNPSNGIGAAAGRMAVAAVYGNDFADGDVEAIQATPTSQFLADLGAVGLWETNQASTATAVTDAIADDAITFRVRGDYAVARFGVQPVMNPGRGSRLYPIYVHEGTGLFGRLHRVITPRRSPVMVFPGGGKPWPVLIGRTGVVVKRSVRGQRAQPYMAHAYEEAAAYVGAHLDEMVERMLD